MNSPGSLPDLHAFSEALYEKMKSLQEGIAELELYEFRYGLDELVPKNGWESVVLEARDEIARRVNSRDFYDRIQIKPRVGDRLVMDQECMRLTQMLFVGLVKGEYPPDWIRQNFYFDVRGFYFLHRTSYFTEQILAHFGGTPLVNFEPKQRHFGQMQDIGYKAFKEANTEVDAFFMDSIFKLIDAHGLPILIAIAGPTAAGKTEIVECLKTTLVRAGKKVTSIELDNFLTDRDYREAKGIHSEGKEALHFELLKQALEDITHGQTISIPRYDFVNATSSHDLTSQLKAGGLPVIIHPADIIFMEGNFPFLLEEIVHLIGIKVVYLTDDPIRLKRKWKRDVDYRKKYDPTYFRNRFFKEQFIMAQIAYLPQMEVCDMAVDTTGAAIWVTPQIRKILGQP